MTFNEAKASGRRAKRPSYAEDHWIDFSDKSELIDLASYEADDWTLEPESVKIWEPKLRDIVYYVNYDGHVEEEGSYPGRTRCKILIPAYNVYRTYEEAECVANYQRVQRKLLALAKDLNGEWKPDWVSGNEIKYIITAYHSHIDVTQIKYSKYSVCFKTEKLAEKALSQLTEEEKEILIKGMQ